jgi:hypothetical protein
MANIFLDGAILIPSLPRTRLASTRPDSTKLCTSRYCGPVGTREWWNYIVEPRGIDEDLKVICAKLNIAAIATMSSDITSTLFTRVRRTDSELTSLPNNITVPVVNSLHDLTTEGCGVRRRNFCCFVRRKRLFLFGVIRRKQSC